MTISSRKFPHWSYEETLLALYAARFSVTGCMDEDDPAIVTLSSQLRSIAPAYASESYRYRNPHGVARKVWHFVAKLGGRPTRAGSPVEEAVWRDFGCKPEALRKAATEIKLAIDSDFASPSRGPVPSIGTALVATHDSAAWLYIAALDHARDAEGPVFLKIGHSVDVVRRMRELNFGFPPPWGAGWRALGRWILTSRNQAYVCEQVVLQAAAQARVSVGKEFLSVSIEQVGSWIDYCAKIADHALKYGDDKRFPVIDLSYCSATTVGGDAIGLERKNSHRGRLIRGAHQARRSRRQMIRRPRGSRQIKDRGVLQPASRGEKT